jgi:hypothetical protein
MVIVPASSSPAESAHSESRFGGAVELFVACRSKSGARLSDMVYVIPLREQRRP